MQEENDCCPVCQGIVRRFWIKDAVQGCTSCQIFAGTLRHFYPPDGPPGKVVLLPNYSGDQLPCVQINDADEDCTPPTRIVFYVTREEDVQSVALNVGDFFGSLAVRRDIEELPSGQPSVDQIITWNHRCRESHPKCQRETPLLPTRVIEVSTEDGHCRLYESHGERADYTALSHCWGKITILRTLKSNIEAHTNCIKLETLPKTFQDAIKITRIIGVRYLWIDSLCIVQDSADDWARESATMASIYRNAYLTLAATAANDGSEGLFKPRQVDTYFHALSSTQNALDGVYIRARRQRRHDCLRQLDDPSYHLGSNPLMTRAWCFQERMLSSRILHFADDEMVWQCQEGRSCECGVCKDYPHDEPSKVIDSDTIAQERKSQALEMEHSWHKKIRDYTSLDITMDTDRLPAFSGIASTLVAANEYMAGIRQSCALDDLLWSSSAEPPPRRPDTYLAPSWSWASVMGQIKNGPPRDDSTNLAQIESISTIKSTVDAFGRVKAGELKISGIYLKALVKQRDENDIMNPSTFSRSWLRVEIPDLQLPIKVWNTVPSLDTIEDAREMIGQSVRLLAMRTQGSGAGAEMHFLMLTRQSYIPSRFRRVGTFDLNQFRIVDGKPLSYTTDEILKNGIKKQLVIV
ncbi:hypothetical protein N8I77_002518 [Diaporthe amygdali]|uniref:Heterokaryon incompatibility domain-containing protein n=1 Tax=Phomopsis amygdali TaxID=1214568 RepID=A0AAD9ST46_PHOAM|nr:hypothetical protein N8I77_002518 [Diaporthe amygdali]